MFSSTLEVGSNIMGSLEVPGGPPSLSSGGKGVSSATDDKAGGLIARNTHSHILQPSHTLNSSTCIVHSHYTGSHLRAI